MQRCGLLGLFVHRTQLPRVETRPEQQVHAPHSLGPRGTRIPRGVCHPGRDGGISAGVTARSRCPLASRRFPGISRPRAVPQSDPVDGDRSRPCNRQIQVPISSDFRRPDLHRKPLEHSSASNKKQSRHSNKLTGQPPRPRSHDIQNSISPKRLRLEKSELNSCFASRRPRANIPCFHTALLRRRHALQHRTRRRLLLGRSR